VRDGCGDRDGLRTTPRAVVGVLEPERHRAVRERGACGERAAAGCDDRRLGLTATVARAEVGDVLTPRLGAADEEALTEEVGEGATRLRYDGIGKIVELQLGDPRCELARDHAATRDRLVVGLHAVSSSPSDSRTSRARATTRPSPMPRGTSRARRSGSRAPHPGTARLRSG